MISAALAFFALSTASAASTAHVVVLDTDTGADAEKVQREVKWRIARPQVEWVADSLPAETAKALHQFPNECAPKLPQAVREGLADLAGENELYVALPTTPRHKDLAVWRWDAKTDRLLLVMNDGHPSQGFEVSGNSARIVQLVWPNLVKQKKFKDDVLGRTHSADPVLVRAGTEYGGFIDTLMEHPNECTPEMTPEMIETLKADAANAPDTDLYLAVRVPNVKSTYMWRWDNDGYLSRMFE